MGKFEYDKDILCPCDHRDPDVGECGACYCALYVRKDLFEEHASRTAILPIPERRPSEKQVRAYEMMLKSSTEKLSETSVGVAKESSKIELKLWYCKQCGFVAFREDPPYVYPICKAKWEMVAEIEIRTTMRDWKFAR